MQIKLLSTFLFLLGLAAGPVVWAQNHNSTAPVSAAVATRFLEQASWGPTPESVAHVEQVGLAVYINEQLRVEPTPIPDAPAGVTNLHTVQQHFFVEAVHGEDQLRQRVAFALGEIFVVSGLKVGRPEAMVPYLRLLRWDAFGNFYDLMRDVTLSPAMGHYLDMVNNDKPNPATGRTANENYARELLQLFTLGTVRLNPDGSTQLDPHGNAVPAYDQTVIENLGRVFTGWTYPTKPDAELRRHNPAYWDGEMLAVEANHDTSAKTLPSGRVLPPNQTAEQDLDDALLDIFHHPNVGPFFARQLIEHLVKSNPSAAYMKRVAAVFNDNGSGVRGDLSAVVRAVLLDDEARAGDAPDATATAEGHMKEPVLFITGLLRALNATVTDDNTLPGAANRMGQNVYYPPSVFNYFSPSYRVPGTTLIGPEFQIHSPTTAMLRADFVHAVVYGQLGKSVQVDLSPFVVAATIGPQTLVGAVNDTLMHGQMPASAQDIVRDAVDGPYVAQAKAQSAVYLAASSSLYQMAH